jgi:hypothetical protein
MAQINTQEMVRTFATNCVRWLATDNRLQAIHCNHTTYRYLNLRLHDFRRYLDKALSFFVDSNVGTETELDLGHYTLTSHPEKSYVVVKRSKRRLPRMSTSYIGWVTWDLAEQEDPSVIKSRVVDQIYGYGSSWGLLNRGLKSRLSLMHASILSQVLLQCLFNIDGPVDLLSKPLPSQDIKCRIGGYEMLYDHLVQEWRIWKKN